MSTRKHRDSQSMPPANGNNSKPETHTNESSGQAKNPGKMMFFIWGIPLILFIVIAIIKQCDG